MDFQLKNEYKVKEIAAEFHVPIDPEAESYFPGCKTFHSYQVLPIRLKSFGIEGDFRFMLYNSGQETQFQMGIIFYNTSAQTNIKRISANIDLLLGIQSESSILNLKEKRIFEKELEFEHFEESEFEECCVPKYPNKKLNSNLANKCSTLASARCYNLAPEVIGPNASLIYLKGNITLKIEIFENVPNNDQLRTSLGDLYNEVLATLANEKNFTLICNGQEFHFNKTLLSMKSEVFARIILGSPTNSITITDFSPETIKAFQKVSFENEEIRNEEFNVEVLLFAKQYEVKSLMEKCVKHPGYDPILVSMYSKRKISTPKKSY